MRILISANGPDWDATIAPAFDTAPYYLLVDTETASCVSHTQGELPPFAQLQVQAVITGQMSTNTQQQASAAGIRLYTIPAGGIKIALDQCIQGKLRLLERRDEE